MITHVAIVRDGKVYSLPSPNRHHHVRQIMPGGLNSDSDADIPGFLDDSGRFLNRTDAFDYVRGTNQEPSHPYCLRTSTVMELYSEDLW